MHKQHVEELMALSAVHSEHSVTAAVREYLTVLGCFIGELNVAVWVCNSTHTQSMTPKNVVLLQVLPRERREGVRMTQTWISSVESSTIFQTRLKLCSIRMCIVMLPEVTPMPSKSIHIPGSFSNFNPVEIKIATYFN